MNLLILFAIAIACAIGCHIVAGRRGANPVFWGIMGFLFGPFALPFVFLTGKKSRR
jgi:hypothetical protein